MATLNKGNSAPEFVLADQREQTVRLSDYRGRKVLIYFYPKANTPGCTIQACSVRDNLAALKTAGTDAVGISPDQPRALLAFDTKYNLGFPLLSDPDHAVAEAYGVWGEKRIMAKIGMGITRSAFLVDEDGKLAGVWYKISPADTVPKVKATLENMV